MNRQHYYIDNHWDKNRNGIACSPQLSPRQSEKGCIDITTRQSGQGTAGIWSPEHLLTAAVSGSFMTAFAGVAEKSRLNFTAFDVRATGVLEQVDDKLVLGEIQLEPTIFINKLDDYERVLQLLQEAQKNSFISESIKTRVTLHPWIQVMEVTIHDDPFVIH